MHLKTLNKSGHIVLKDYTETEYRDIIFEKNGYVLRRIHRYGYDYGGSQCSDECEVTYEEIIPERILVKDGHFYGVCICTDFEYMNGGFRKYAEEVLLFADGTGVQFARSGSDFSNDDHSRWDYTDFYLMNRDSAMKMQDLY